MCRWLSVFFMAMTFGKQDGKLVKSNLSQAKVS